MRVDYNLEAENLDKYFLDSMLKLNSKQREVLPDNLLSKVFKSTGLSIKTVSFFEKIYMLQKAFNKEIFIVIEDHETGIGIEDFLKFKKEFKKKQYNTISESTELVSKGAIVLGRDDLINHMHHKNMVSVSNAYRFALKLKNIRPSAKFNYRKESVFFAEMLLRYETSKKKIAKERGLNTAQFYVLLYLYDGIQKKAVSAYNGVFTDTFNAGRSQIMSAFKKLKEHGYIEAFGDARQRTYKLTPMGKDLINEIIFKYIAV